MANMEKRSDFEDQWRDAFEDAEIKPSANLWKNIDNQLTMQENGKYRKGFVFYRAVAAACLICLLGMGYFVLQNNLESSENELATQPENQQQNQLQQPIEQDENENLALEDSSGQTEQSEQTDMQTRRPADTETLTLSPNKADEPKGADSSNQNESSSIALMRSLPQDAQHAKRSVLASPEDTNGTQAPASRQTIFIPLENSALATLAYITPQGISQAEMEEDTWAKEIDRLYKVPQTVIKDKKTSQKPEFFAGLNLATNYFDPNYSGGGGNELAFASALSPPSPEFNNMDVNMNAGDQRYNALSSRSTPSSSGLDNKPQISISYGVDVGYMLSKHISIETGLDYGRMNTKTQTSWISENYTQGERIPLLASNARANTQMSDRTQFSSEELQLTNSFSFLSVPLKLGYNLGLGRRLHFNISSGFAANFFLNNRLSDDNGELNTVNIRAEEGSPFRPVYYSAVVSGGVNYLIAGNYSLSVSPNYNFSLSSLTEEGNTFNSQPNALGIDVGIRYLFR